MQRVRLGMKLMTRQKDRWKQEEKKRKDKTGEKVEPEGGREVFWQGRGGLKESAGFST